MRKIIEYSLISVDGVFSDPAGSGFMSFRDDAYVRDGLGLLTQSEAMLMGRVFYDSAAGIWPGRTEHPWARRLNDMKKYVVSSTLSDPAWNNTEVLNGDPLEEIRRLKNQDGGDIVIWGHTRLAETLMRNGLVDVLDVSVHPVLVGSGDLLWRDGLHVDLQLVSAKTFQKIVKLTYEPRYK
jgi:dihydrofolate reductase